MKECFFQAGVKGRRKDAIIDPRVRSHLAPASVMWVFFCIGCRSVTFFFTLSDSIDIHFLMWRYGRSSFSRFGRRKKPTNMEHCISMGRVSEHISKVGDSLATCGPSFFVRTDPCRDYTLCILISLFADTMDFVWSSRRLVFACNIINNVIETSPFRLRLLSNDHLLVLLSFVFGNLQIDFFLFIHYALNIE